MTMAAKSFLLREEDPELRRWLMAAAFVTAAHGGLVLWLMNKHDANLAGTPPAAIMIELAPVDVARPAETPPDVTEGPQMTQADPEEVEPPQTLAVPELPPAPKPAVVLMTPPKAKPKPKKIVKEIPKPVVKRTREPPEPRTNAPRAAMASNAAASPASNAADAAAWRSSWAGMNWNRHYPEAARARGERGTVRLALTIGRSGQVMSARLVGSSGSSTLDQAALEMARHASGRPLPPEMGSSVSLIVPVRYSIR
ncbi:MAG TPA: energy transducer TonB [Methylocella sp.]|nr:energy transducer TonB [Methylocella sp.]